MARDACTDRFTAAATPPEPIPDRHGDRAQPGLELLVDERPAAPAHALELALQLAPRR